MAKMKNIISIVFAVAILACSLCACGGNTEPETTAAPVETTAGALTSAELEYVLLEDGTVKITAYKGNGLDEAGESLKTYTIPDEIDGKKVTVIASGAFKDAFRVEGNDLGTAVTFPRNIVTVEEKAFEGSAISRAYIEHALSFRTLGDMAFANCDKLVQVTLPLKTETIGSKAFYLCTALRVATIRSNDIKIAEDAFDIGVNKAQLHINCNEDAEKVMAYADKVGIEYKLLLVSK